MVIVPIRFLRMHRAAMFAVLLLISRALFGQVSFATVQVDGHLVSPRTLFRAAVTNLGGATRAVIDGEIKVQGAGPVVSFRTAPFLVPAGTSMIGAADVEMAGFSYGVNDAARVARQYQRLPAGHYTWCLRLLSTAGEQQDEYCDALEEDAYLYLDLVQPWDQDTIEEVRPALQWMLSGSDPLAATADVRIVLVPAEGKKAAQAIATERPLFIVPHVRERVLAFPFGVPDLERGKCYAWQAERLEGTQVADRSEPWRFCVRPVRLPEGNKYVLLGKQVPGSVYEAVDRKIHFRYDEPYTSTQLDCSIYDKDRRRVDPKVKDDQATSGAAVGARSVGVNLYELDLQPYALSAGHYQLVVRNEKGMRFELDFHVTP